MTLMAMIQKFRISGLILTMLLICQFSCHSNFDPDKWKADTSKRKEQSIDLIKSGVLIDKSYKEIIHLLGGCDVDSRLNKLSDEAEAMESFTLKYFLGGCNWIDFEKMVIEFENDTVVKVYKECD